MIIIFDIVLFLGARVKKENMVVEKYDQLESAA